MDRPLRFSDRSMTGLPQPQIASEAQMLDTFLLRPSLHQLRSGLLRVVSQRQSCRPPHPRRRRQAPFPAEILTRPEPNRTGLRQAQTFTAQGRRANRRGCLRGNRSASGHIHPPGMCQLLQKLRIRANLESSRFRARDPSGSAASWACADCVAN